MKLLRKRVIMNLIGNAYQQQAASQEISQLLNTYQNIKTKEIYISENKYNIMYNLQHSRNYDENIIVLINHVIPHRYSPQYLRILNNNICFYSDQYFYPYSVKLINNKNIMEESVILHNDSEIDSTYVVGNTHVNGRFKRLYSLCSHLN